MKLEMLTSDSSPSQNTRVSVKRWCSTCIYYWNPYSNRQTWTNLFFFHRCQCERVTGINGNTFSNQPMLFGAFLMKNIFIFFPTHILNYIFAQFRGKFHVIQLDYFVVIFLCTTTSALHQTKHMKSIGFSDEIM